MHEPSPEQKAFYEALRTTSASLLVQAVAGSGKTTTIVNSLREIANADALNILFLAFNKSIVATLSERVPHYCTVKTFHALGLAAWRKRQPKAKVDGDKVRNLLKKELKLSDFWTYGTAACKLISWAKSAGIGTSLVEDEPRNWFSLMSHQAFTFDEGDEDQLVAIARGGLAKSNACEDILDFDDMLYLPLLRNAQFDKNNIVFIDEAQDTNGVQRALLTRMLAPEPHGRLIAVGDEQQSIYGFRGADAYAMSLMQKQFNMTSLPLSVSWRCSKAVVREAQRV